MRRNMITKSNVRWYDDDMIYTYVNMYIAFVTPVMDIRDRDQV